jgi:hypothetical protein
MCTVLLLPLGDNLIAGNEYIYVTLFLTESRHKTEAVLKINELLLNADMHAKSTDILVEVVSCLFFFFVNFSFYYNNIL